jgi:hypothetical protein
VNPDARDRDAGTEPPVVLGLVLFVAALVLAAQVMFRLHHDIGLPVWLGCVGVVLMSGAIVFGAGRRWGRKHDWRYLALAAACIAANVGLKWWLGPPS